MLYHRYVGNAANAFLAGLVELRLPLPVVLAPGAPGGFAFGGARGATLEKSGEEAPGNGAVEGTDGKQIESGHAQAEKT